MNLAVIQLISTPDIDQNITQISQQLQTLRSDCPSGELLVVLPECCLMFGRSEAQIKTFAEPAGEGKMQAALVALARQFNVYLVAGTIPLQADDGRSLAASLLIDPQGKVIAQYNKIHLFDVDVADGIGSYRESDNTQPGQHISVIDTPFGRIGMAVCYDLRFSSLFRAMRHAGADIFVLPSAFTKITGQAHWELLLRARAIENQCYMVASNQGGTHANGRETWGHSMIVNPWGEITAQLAAGIGAVACPLNRDMQHAIQQKMPMIEQERFTLAQLT
ncbi:MAG: carbon-nitrogen hydrolase family protein [Gammaproteobacteria bacterium]|nr:carbon-nitrogen hydrolase family protein [Gammaproteobacteria bacterium]